VGSVSGRALPGGSSAQGGLGRGVVWGGLEALIYMGGREHGVRGKVGLRPQVWRVFRVRDGDRGKVEMPVSVSHVLKVAESGERGLAQVAGAQRAMVHRSQLRALGITQGSYEHRVRVGALHRVLPSVLSVVSPIVEPLGQETAALLYAGKNAVLSHESAAALWGMTPHPSFVAITIIGRHPRRQPGLRLHEVDALDVRDVRIHNGFPVTSPARTLIDCAATDLPLDRLLNEARVLKLVTDVDIRAAIDRCPQRKGTRRLRQVLEAERETGYTRSEAERRLKVIVQSAKIEPPVFNTSLEGIHPDAYWPRLKVVVEVDGYGAHAHWAAFQRDRARDNRLVAAGYVVLRFTWHQLTRDPMRVLAEIVRTLARREFEAA
jgi:very-short-patch-repair endonuclease